MKMMLLDVIGHENQSQHCPDHQCLCLVLSGRITTPDRFSYHTGKQSIAALAFSVAGLKTACTTLALRVLQQWPNSSSHPYGTFLQLKTVLQICSELKQKLIFPGLVYPVGYMWIVSVLS